MPVTVFIPTPLRGLTGNRSQVAAAGATVRQVLDDLSRAHPGLRARLLTEDGAPRRHLGLFLNDEDVRALGGLDAAVREGDELQLVPAIAGGAPELTEHHIARWARQLLVPGFGAAGQERLMAARVRVVGADAVAGPALVYLVQAGVGKLWLDDPDLVGPADLGGWLYGPEAAGRPRVEAAAEALARLSRFVVVERYPAGGVPTATLVVASSAAQALGSAEPARRARVPHVVLEADGDGGAFVSVPPGAPCYACGRLSTGSGRPPSPGAAALAALAAQELLLLIADPGAVTGRRVEMIRGISAHRPTARLPGCACNPPPPPGAAAGPPGPGEGTAGSAGPAGAGQGAVPGGPAA
ncbi:MAG: ThiF family adenylyltransferase [Anaeromyxobacter sp.]|nr:ThiF family adenylyltransferase [Anaeromyxobacter sp.]MBL0277790.1 ThiF family adenylyltransferase [Anaeromyxobacter sp.]